jgi:heterodisulfide reductase subunit B2
VKFAYFPGCSMETSARMYEASLHRVLGALGVELEEIPDWNCCGASATHALEPAVAVGLAARNLGLAEKNAAEVVTGCPSCFFRLRAAEEAMKGDATLATRVNGALPVAYEGKIRIRNVLDVLLEALAKAPAKPAVKRRLAALRPACYYGCLFGRAAGDQSYDDPENPTAMERLLAAAGVEAIDWNGKVDCCGASAAIVSPATASGLQAGLLEDARARGANAIVVACPMCQVNLDMGQYRKRLAEGEPAPLPVLFVTQVLGLAWGFADDEMETGRLLTPSAAVAEVLA